MIAEHVPITMSARAIAEIDHRLEVIAGGFGEGNSYEAVRLRAGREADELRRARIARAAHLWSLHTDLARQHHCRYIALLKERAQNYWRISAF